MSRHRLRVIAFAAMCLLSTAVPAATDRVQSEMPSTAVEALDAARALRRAGDYEDARASLERIVRDHEDYYLAWYNLALTHVHLEEFDLAIRSYEQALSIRDRLDLGEPRIFNSAGWAYLLEGNFSRAEALLLVGAEPDNVARLGEVSRQRLFNNLGLLYTYKEDLDKAAYYYAKAAASGSTTAMKRLETVGEMKAKQSELSSYKVDIYYNKESEADETLTRKIRAALEKEGRVRRVVLAPRVARFFSQIGAPKNLEIRYDPGSEATVARSLQEVLLALDPSYRFKLRPVVTPTPGTMSLVIYSGTN